MDADTIQEYYTVKEAAQIIKCSPPFIHQRIRRGELSVYKVGTKCLIPVASVHRFIEANTYLASGEN